MAKPGGIACRTMCFLERESVLNGWDGTSRPEMIRGAWSVSFLELHERNRPHEPDPAVHREFEMVSFVSPWPSSVHPHAGPPPKGCSINIRIGGTKKDGDVG